MLGLFDEVSDKFYAEHIRFDLQDREMGEYRITQIFTLVLKKQLQNKEN
jgi:hypothetical protein